MNGNNEGTSTIEWFGASTFRLKTNGIIIFLDTWLERPSSVPSFLSIDDVTECDYIFISHAHFDHLPGSDRMAKRTGAIVISNGEAINVMKAAGVPEEQLVPVAGGERIPLFTKADREEAKRSEQGKFGPPEPDVSKAAASVHVWPSLHCLMPGEPGVHPEFIDTATEYHGAGSPYACTLDITKIMKHMFVDGAQKMSPEDLAKVPPNMKPIIEFLRDTDKNKYSHFDGGQLAFNFLLGDKTLFWNSLLGGYEGVFKEIQPQPDIAIMGIAGRGNINGRPFDGSAAQCGTNIVRWIGEPKTMVWCLHDEMPFEPKRTITTAATEMVERETKSKIWSLDHAKAYKF
ncbi:hypothetical protein NA57DRAFT_75194 [Rhizodiscina lignyota]|uniref:Metallo-beta-lactamase domain-containing protein n=1 Tax=Rhizodiscina lignyota TaxID=1504668 RepID=A0A9P4II35_9PEZI|nr:hypothetical protein NA57DRAFT_75194 [Rhizodiscina lignyota]